MSKPRMINTVKPLKINIYGNSAAGKTRFLYELIRQLKVRAEKTGQTVELNEVAQKVFRDEDVRRKNGQNTWTTQELENIVIKIPNNFFSPDGTGLRIVQSWKPDMQVDLIFPDVVGETIRNIIDNANATPEDWEKVNELLRSCAFFVCFFDPTCSNAARASSEDIYAAELRRRTTLIQKVPASRPSNPLPILFIQTHSDILNTWTFAKCVLTAEIRAPNSHETA